MSEMSEIMSEIMSEVSEMISLGEGIEFAISLICENNINRHYYNNLQECNDYSPPFDSGKVVF